MRALAHTLKARMAYSDIRFVVRTFSDTSLTLALHSDIRLHTYICLSDIRCVVRTLSDTEFACTHFAFTRTA